MGLLLLVPGLILWLAGGGWFSNATTVGQILTAVGAAILFIQVAIFAFVALFASKKF